MSERNWASDDDYTDKVYDNVDVLLPRSGDWMRVQQRPPMQFAQLAENYEMGEIQDQVESRDDDLTIEDTDVGEVKSTIEFLENEIMPCIIRPKNAHWADPPDDPDLDEVFDVSSLHEDDLDKLISSVTANEGGNEEKTNETGEYDGQFQGESDGDRNRDDGREVREAPDGGRSGTPR